MILTNGLPNVPGKIVRTFKTIAVYSALFYFVVGLGFSNAAMAQPKLTLAGVQKIWDQATYNSFTDLTRQADRFYCVFREGTGHVSPEGKIRVLCSTDTVTWESTALIALDGFDLRDPKIVVQPDGKSLMINGGAAVRVGDQQSTEEHSFVSFSADGKEWSKPEWIAGVNQWLWRVTGFGGKYYGVAYSVSPESRSKKQYGTTLLASEDGKTYSALVPTLFQENGPTEATLRFTDDGTCYCLQRRDGSQLNTALLGISKPPYTEWQWKDLGRYLGGPELIHLPSGQWLAAGRIHTENGAQTALCSLDVENGILQPLLNLPSGGDTSYPGMVWHENTLWISYYSSHEGKSSIYFAKVTVQ